jgi:hypothetical protein
LDDDSGLGGKLDKALRVRGADCKWIDAARSFEFPKIIRDAVDGAGASCRGVVWLCRPSPADDPAAGAFESTIRVLSIAQTLARMGLRDAPKLVLVTAGCQSIGIEASPPAVAQAPLWGLARTIAMEHPEFDCTCIDLQPEAGDVELDGLVEEFQSQDHEALIALRGEARYVAPACPLLRR